MTTKQEYVPVLRVLQDQVVGSRRVRLTAMAEENAWMALASVQRDGKETHASKRGVHKLVRTVPATQSMAAALVLMASWAKTVA